MKKVDLNQTINTLANIGVIAGIVFLGAELRQTNRLATAEAEFNVFQYETDFASTGYENPEVAEFLVSVREKARNGEELTAVEQFRVRRLMDVRFSGWEWLYLQNQAGTLNEMDALGRNISLMFENPEFWAPAEIFAQHWDIWSRNANPDFVQFVETLLEGQQ